MATTCDADRRFDGIWQCLHHSYHC